MPATCGSPTTSSRSNGGAYAGAIRLGTPDVAEPLTDHHNDNVRSRNNRIIANGGTNLAGAIGVFAGADNYEIAYNDICGNFSAEYGGGISHYGYSPNGQIHHNRIYFNRSYDEGGGIMIAGELPADGRQPLARRRTGEYLRQPDPGQPGERRRRRPALPDGRQLSLTTSTTTSSPTTSRPTRAAASRSTMRPTCASITTPS